MQSQEREREREREKEREEEREREKEREEEREAERERERVMTWHLLFSLLVFSVHFIRVPRHQFVLVGEREREW